MLPGEGEVLHRLTAVGDDGGRVDLGDGPPQTGGDPGIEPGGPQAGAHPQLELGLERPAAAGEDRQPDVALALPGPGSVEVVEQRTSEGLGAPPEVARHDVEDQTLVHGRPGDFDRADQHGPYHRGHGPQLLADSSLCT